LVGLLIIIIKNTTVAVVGPATQEVEVLEKMMESGMSVVRMNFSHGTYEVRLSLTLALYIVDLEYSLYCLFVLLFIVFCFEYLLNFLILCYVTLHSTQCTLR